MNTHKTIALLGGTFDPIHKGHIIPAKHVAQWLNVDQVRLMPANIPPHKNTVIATPQQRVDMVKLVCDNDALFICDERELNRTEPSYTVDTLKELKKEHPNSRLFFIIGMDSLLTFTQWKDWQDILTLCHLVVNCRPNYALVGLSDETQALIKHYSSPVQAQYSPVSIEQSLNESLIDSNAGQLFFAPEIAYNISSTEIRNNLKSHSSCKELLPENVLNYIQQHKLYL